MKKCIVALLLLVPLLVAFAACNQGQTSVLGGGVIVSGTPLPGVSAEPLSVEGLPPLYSQISPDALYPFGELGLSGETDYFLYLEKGSYTLTVYAKDDDGHYTRVERTILCAIGKTPALTATGLHTITRHERWHQFGEDRAYAQYVSKFASGRYIHSALYEGKNIRTMYRDSYEEIGQSVTGGCLRMTAEDAYWIYKNCPNGTQMFVTNGSPLGTQADTPPPLEDRHHRDPTDPGFQDDADDE